MTIDVTRGDWRYVQTRKDAPSYPDEPLIRHEVTHQKTMSRLTDPEITPFLAEAIQDEYLSREQLRIIKAKLRQVLPPKLVASALSSLDQPAVWSIKPDHAENTKTPEAKKNFEQAGSEKPANHERRTQTKTAEPVIPDDAVCVGPFAYDEQTNRIFFEVPGEKPRLVKLSGTTSKILAAMIVNAGKPLKNIDIERLLYGTDTGAKAVNNRIQSHGAKLKKDLEKRLPGSTAYIFHDLQGYRVLATSDALTLNSVLSQSEEAVLFGPWTYDKRYDVIYYEDSLCKFRESTHAAIRLAIETAPNPVGTDQLPDIGAVAKEINANLSRIHPDAKLGFHRSKAMEQPENPAEDQSGITNPTRYYVLDISPYELDQNMLDAMQIIEIGDIIVSMKQRRIWVDGDPVEVYPKEWETYACLISNRIENTIGPTLQFMPSADIAAASNATMEQTFDRLDHLRKKMNAVREGAGDTHIVGKLGYGYVICANQDEFITAIRYAASLRPRSRQKEYTP